MNKVLVTGATGFIGRRVVSRLRKEGWDVLAVSRNGEGGVSLDLKDTEFVRFFLKKERPDHLMHLAWNVNANSMESLENLEWVIASLELLKAFAENGGKKAVFAGSCAEYDWRYGFLSEDLTPLASGSFYGVSKSALGKLALAYAQQSHLDFAWGRIFFLYGVGEKRDRLVPSLISSFLKGEIPDLRNPHIRRDYLYVDDVAAALLALLSSSFNGSVNIASGEAIRLADIGCKIARLLGREVPPCWGSEMIGEELYPLVLGDVRRLNEIIGFKPAVTWDKGLRDTIEKFI